MNVDLWVDGFSQKNGIPLATCSQLTFLRQVKALKKSAGVITEAFYVVDKHMEMSWACANHRLYFSLLNKCHLKTHWLQDF